MKRILTVTVIATWAVLLLGGAFRPQGFTLSGPPRPDVGHQAPDLAVVSPQMAPVELAELRGKAVFLNFWASWCGPCRMEMPEIQRLYESLPEGTAILTVNMTTQESSPEAAMKYLKEHGYTFPVALDPTGEAGERFRALSLPTSLFISPDGVVTARISGPLSQRAMTEYLASAAQAKPAAPTGPQRPSLSLGAYLPEAFNLGPAVLPTRALFWLAGAILAYGLAGRSARRKGLEAEAAQDLVVNLAMGSILGAKLLYVLLDPQAYLGSPSLLLAFPYGALALPGALVGGVGLAAWGLRRNQNRLALLDQVAPALVLGAGIGAIGSADPGGWALGPLLLLAGAASTWGRLRAAEAGQSLGLTLTSATLAIVLADLARPAATAAGVTALQLASALVGTGAWFWQRRA